MGASRARRRRSHSTSSDSACTATDAVSALMSARAVARREGGWTEGEIFGLWNRLRESYTTSSARVQARKRRV